MHARVNVFVNVWLHVFLYTAVFKIIEGQFPAFQRVSSSKLVPETVESRFLFFNGFPVVNSG
jgi:hypothetical protein